MNATDFVAELAKIGPSSTFMTVKGYRNEYSEIADYNIIFNFSYENALQKSLKLMEQFVPTSDLEEQAKQDLIVSFKTSLKKVSEEPIEKRVDAYHHFPNVKGVKMHLGSGELHIYGLVVHKRVLMPGMYPEKNSSPLTQTKNRLRATTPVGKFRQFRMLPYQVNSISVGRTSISPPEG